jgi:putative transposase
VNSEIAIGDDQYIFERQCTDGVWILKNKVTGRQLERTYQQIFDEYVSGTLFFKSKEPRNISSLQVRNLQDIPKTGPEVEAAKIRMAYVRAVRDLPRTQKLIEEAIDEVWEKLSPQPSGKPNWTSVYRWMRAFVASESAPRSLLVDQRAKGNREPRFPKEILQLCEAVIEETYLTLERPTLEHCIDISRARTRELNRMQPQSSQLPLPTRWLMQRLVDQIPAYDVHVSRYGREAARKKYRTSVNHRITDGPLQRGEMDHTRMDVFVVDDVSGMPLGRPWLTILIDDFTRCVLGYCLSFEPPSRATVARCLRHAFMPKSSLKSECPDLKNEWAPFGVVSELVLDGGAEFHSEELENICFELDIEQHFSPRKTPWFKGKVERFQGTLNRGVAINTPGKTFEGIVDRDDYDPKKHAIVPMSLLRQMTIRWIVDVYHQKIHRSIGCTPAQMWESNIRPHNIPMVSDPLRFDAIVGGSEMRVLSHKGIEFAGLVYNSPEMGDLRRHLGDRINVDVRVNRSNLGSVIVLHPERGTPMRVPCLQKEYAEGLTEWQHSVCKRYARQRLNSEGDADAWLDALLEISEMVRTELNMGKRRGVTRERMARWSEGKQVIAQDSVEVPLKKPDTKTKKSLQKAATAEPPATTTNTAPALFPPVVRKHFTPIFEDRKPNGLRTADGEANE